MSTKYTCISCRVAFTDGDLQRQHYKTEWHRYNLKRKVAELPPVTTEEFEKKAQRQQDAQKKKETGIFCKVCRKPFQTSKAFSNHLNSKRHREGIIQLNNASLGKDENDEDVTMEMNHPIPDLNDISCPSIGKINRSKPSRVESVSSMITDDSDIEEVDSDEWDEDVSDNNPIVNNNCLFCSHHSSTQMKNVKHMTMAHSFFIPDADYITDLKGLLLYLGEKVCQGFFCLWCNDRGRAFHSMQAAQNHMLDKGHCKMLHEGEALLEYANFYDYTSSYPDHQTFEFSDEEIQLNVLDGSDYELVLPSGARIGHRSLMRYYRQNFDPNRVVVPAHKRVNRVVSHYKSLGWTGTEKEIAVRKARDLKYMHRVQSKHMMQVGVKANKLNRPRPIIIL